MAKNTYSMNKQQQRRREQEPDADEFGGASDSDQDDLIPEGHELDEIRVKPAENGFTVNHQTRPKPGHKPKGGKSSGLAEPYDYRGKDRVFEDHSRAAGHVLKVMAAHKKAKSKK